MRLQAALARFRTQLQADGRSPHTAAQYARHVRRFGEWLEAERVADDVPQLQPEYLAALIAAAEAQHRRDGGPRRADSLNGLRPSLRGFFGFFERVGQIERSPAPLLRMARVAPTLPRGMRPVVYQQVDTVYRAKGILRSTPTLVLGNRHTLAEALEHKEPGKVNTSYIERLNLVQRSCCALLRRRTPHRARLMSSVEDALELVRVTYNFIRCHASLRTSSGKQTPAMAAGLAERPLTLLEVLQWRPPSAWWRKKRLEEAFSAC